MTELKKDSKKEEEQKKKEEAKKKKEEAKKKKEEAIRKKKKNLKKDEQEQPEETVTEEPREEAEQEGESANEEEEVQETKAGSDNYCEVVPGTCRVYARPGFFSYANKAKYQDGTRLTTTSVVIKGVILESHKNVELGNGKQIETSEDELSGCSRIGDSSFTGLEEEEKDLQSQNPGQGCPLREEVVSRGRLAKYN
eukprot:g28307.t1